MQTLTLTSGSLLRMALAPGRQLRCASGRLWLTFDGEDVVLAGGEHWTAPGQGIALVEAMSASARLQLDAVVAPHRNVPRRAHRQPIFGGINALKHSL
ncbi:DUF2917 domain-containing protein [Jeongeupia chitinilytica]|uniref:DUF2917 domain-containing protein n=1 Tax=Jeongeupia chitinilytica TaxID=1041641 RepID=A0ABQ3GZY0_9NEIS|nr:DUF2917 domain-containing protein [Jeongeupia chitinilytica]GHD60523.1 hypothetical protein GCM10007350_13690 [Jeongeupia chitinilytica]